MSAPAEGRCVNRVRGRSLVTRGTVGCADVLLTAVSAVSLTAVDAIDAVGHPPAGRCPEPVRVQAFAWHRRLSRARVISRKGSGTYSGLGGALLGARPSSGPDEPGL